jgi:hypothetical protein
MNTRLEQLVKKKIDAGGTFLSLESKEIFGAYIDWTNCLMITRTPKVHETVQSFLKETISNRFDHIKAVLQENIADTEAGLLIMREEERQFLDLPEDIELFLVTPPAYDDLIHFINDSESGTEYWRTV